MITRAFIQHIVDSSCPYTYKCPLAYRGQGFEVVRFKALFFRNSAVLFVAAGARHLNCNLIACLK